MKMWFLGALVGVLLLPGAVWGEEKPLELEAVVPFGSSWVSGHPPSVRIDLKYSGSTNRSVKVSLEGLSASCFRSLDLAPGAKKSVWIYCPTLRNAYSVHANVTDLSTRESLVRESLLLRTRSERGVAYIGRRPVGLKSFEEEYPDPDKRDYDAPQGFSWVARAFPDELPDSAKGYDSLSVLFWSEPSLSSLSPLQVQALRRWVAGGGHLILAPGEKWEELSRGPLGDILPAKISGVDLVERSSLDSSLIQPEGGLLQVLQGEPIQGLRFPYKGAAFSTGEFAPGWTRFWGRGRVTLWRVGKKALNQDIKGHMWRGWVFDKSHEDNGHRVWEIFGGDEPSLALDVWVLFALLGFFLLWIGPVEYLTLRRIKRLEWTLVTFPAAVFVLVGGVWWVMSSSFSRGSISVSTEILKWPLPEGAVVGAEGRPRGSSAEKERRLLVEFFAATRTPVDLHVPGAEGFWGGTGSNPFLSQGEKIDLEVDRAALAMDAPPYQRTTLSAWRFEPPEEKPPVVIDLTHVQREENPWVAVTNQGDKALSLCWFQGERRYSEVFQRIGPGERVEMKIAQHGFQEGLYDIKSDPDVVPADIDAMNKLRQVMFSYADSGNNYAELVCMVDRPHRLKIQGLTSNTEQDPARSIVHFVF